MRSGEQRDASFASLIAQTQVALEDGRYNRACRLYDQARTLAGHDSVKLKELQSLDRLFEIQGRMMFTRAQDEYNAGRLTTAVVRLRVLQFLCPIPAIRQQATERMKQITRSPRGRAAIKEVQARALLRRVIRTIATANTPTTQPTTHPAGQLTQAEKIMRLDESVRDGVFQDMAALQDRYATTPTGRKATAIWQQMIRHAPLAKAYRTWRADREAKVLYDKAQMYQATGNNGNASDCYREIIKRYPASQFAAKAKRSLRSLP
jgi:TolA-binding protein